MKLEEKIYKKLATKHNLSEKQITDICRSAWGFLVETIESGNQEAVRLPYMGVFQCKPRRVSKLKEKNLL
jgi:nucleoid DNA-binding protein